MKINELAKINPKTKLEDDSFINYIDTSSVIDGALLGVQYLDKDYPSRAQRVVEKFDILISSVRPNLKHNYFVKVDKENLIASTGFIQIRCKTNAVIPQYLYYFLSSEKRVTHYTTIADSSQTTFPSFNKDVIENLEIDLPNLQTQQHIVDTIGSVDDLIEKYEEIYEKTDQYLSLLFDTFENENRTKLVDCFTTFNGGTFKSKEYVDCSELKLITIKNIDDNGFNTNKTSFLNSDIVDKKYLLKIGDVLLTMTGNVGRLGIVDEPNCFLNQRVLKLDCISKLYLYLYLKKYKNKIIQLGKGTAQQNLSLQDLNLLDVLNSFEEIKEFKNYDFYFEYLLNIKLKIKKLKEEKDLLLKKYFG